MRYTHDRAITMIVFPFPLSDPSVVVRRRSSVVC
jgi:hypothetical protein